MKLIDNYIRSKGFVAQSEVPQLARTQGFVAKDVVEKIAAKSFSNGKKFATRSYVAGRVDRLSADFPAVSLSIDQDLLYALRNIRARGRHLAQNDAFAKKFLHLTRANAVGPSGFTLRVKGLDTKGNVDRATSKKLEKDFAEWSRRENCTVTGTMSLRAVDTLIEETIAREGEIFIRKIYSPDFEFGMKLQVIEPDYVDERLNHRNPVTKNVVRLGIEFDKLHRPVTYYFREAIAEFDIFGIGSQSYRFIPVPASEVYHLFDRERADQSRGVPRLVTAMLTLNMLGGWDESALTNARIASSKFGAWVNKNGTVEEPVEDEEEPETGNQIDTVEAGEFVIAPPGTELQQFDPKYPEHEHGPFTKSMLRRVAGGTNVTYESLGNDRESVNYSSIRTGKLEEWDGWRMVHADHIETMSDPLYRDWLSAALMAGRLPYIKWRQYDQYKNGVWSGRGWDWVDPLKDVISSTSEVAAGMNSLRRQLAERGLDYEEIIDELAADIKYARDAGLELNFTTPDQILALVADEPAQPKAGETPPPPDPEEEKAKAAARALVDAVFKRKNGHAKHAEA